MSAYTGACHCGQTAFEATLSPEQAKHTLCHCDACKILSGGAYSINSVVPKASLNVTKGGDALKEYIYKGDSGKDVHCYYCPNCTTHIYHHAEVMGDQVIVRTGLLDEGRKSFGAGIELYGKDRMGWVKESAPTFPVFPPA
ncbi:putative glutathione-dependent formaldehyde-activating enzyme-4 [Elsinoe australis]|uniref:Putative glutathione-dependent formaldehyde-activating enzyme-4 n=1 Tax=Elsinoe australis TaxID=40998 RepID=A0A4U7AYG5_9PEZI|nr:putative glutathione-dependent formaldehyde-activating enzyme-4 [Elsinoe australis]